MLHKARTFLNTITVIHIEVHRKTYYYVIKNRFLYHKLKIEQHLHSTFPFELLLFFFFILNNLKSVPDRFENYKLSF